MRKDIPNQLTIARLFLAVAFFAVLNQFRIGAGGEPVNAWALPVALALFVIAALTDAADGHLARKWQVVSKFGRVMDPVADKLLIIGAFIYLAGPRFAIPPAPLTDAPPQSLTGVYPWMVVVILLRELLVTGIRAEMESSGYAFPANIWGKLKMILQCIIVPIILLLVWLADPTEGPARWGRDVLVWATVIVTAISGLPYVTRALAAIRARKQEATR